MTPALVLGIVCERDLLAEKAFLERSPDRLAAERRHDGRGKAAAATAASLVTSPAMMTRAEATTGEAARLMYRHAADPSRSWTPVCLRLGCVVFPRPDVDVRAPVQAGNWHKDVPSRVTGNGEDAVKSVAMPITLAGSVPASATAAGTAFRSTSR